MKRLGVDFRTKKITSTWNLVNRKHDLKTGTSLSADGYTFITRKKRIEQCPVSIFLGWGWKQSDKPIEPRDMDIYPNAVINGYLVMRVSKAVRYTVMMDG